MSASRERKLRSQQAQKAEPAKQPKKKLSEGWVFAISIILVIALVFVGIFVYRKIQQGKTVLTVGEHEISVKEFNYFYGDIANQLGSYVSYMNIESGVALDDQLVSESDAQSWNYEYGQTPKEEVTWAHVFAQLAMNNAAQTYAFYDDAMANGFADDHVGEEVDASIAQIRTTAEASDMSLDEYLEAIFGASADEDSYREYLRVTHIASHYSNSLYESKTYSADEIQAYFDEHAEAHTYATYYLYTVNASDFVETEEGETEESETAPEPTKVEREAAAEAAEAMVENFDVADEKVTLYADQIRSTVTNYALEEAATWLFDEAKKDDVKMFTSEDENTCYVLKLVDKEDYQTVNALTITIANDPEELAEGETPAADKIAAIVASLEADPSEENFRKLLEEYPTEDTTGELTGWARGSMLSTSEDVLMWAAFEDRTAGDYEVFETSSGTKIVFFLGHEKSYRDTNINTALIDEYLSALADAAVAACGYDEATAMKANVDLAYNSES